MNWTASSNYCAHCLSGLRLKIHRDKSVNRTPMQSIENINVSQTVNNQTHVCVDSLSHCSQTVIQSAINQKPMFVDCQSFYRPAKHSVVSQTFMHTNIQSIPIQIFTQSAINHVSEHVGNLSNSVHICNQNASQEMHNQSSVNIGQSVRSQSMQGDSSQSISNQFLSNVSREMHNESSVSIGQSVKNQLVYDGNQSIYSQFLCYADQSMHIQASHGQQMQGGSQSISNQMLCNASEAMNNQSSVGNGQSVKSQFVQGGSQSVCNEVLCNASQAMHNLSSVGNGQSVKSQSMQGDSQSVFNEVLCNAGQKMHNLSSVGNGQSVKSQFVQGSSQSVFNEVLCNAGQKMHNLSSVGNGQSVKSQSACSSQSAVYQPVYGSNCPVVNQPVFDRQAVNNQYESAYTIQPAVAINIINELFKNGSDNMRQFIQSQYLACNKNDSRGHRWNEQFLAICLRMWCRSPQAYDDLRASNLMLMPSSRLLSM